MARSLVVDEKSSPGGPGKVVYKGFNAARKYCQFASWGKSTYTAGPQRGHWSLGDRVLGCKGVPGSAVHRHLVHLSKQVEDGTVPYPGSRGWGTPALHGNKLCISSAQAWPRSRSGSSHSCAWDEEVVCNTKKERKRWGRTAQATRKWNKIA